MAVAEVQMGQVVLVQTVLTDGLGTPKLRDLKLSATDNASGTFKTSAANARQDRKVGLQSHDTISCLRVELNRDHIWFLATTTPALGSHSNPMKINPDRTAERLLCIESR